MTSNCDYNPEIVESDCEIVINFSCTNTIDPDLGSNQNLIYNIYASLTNPNEFQNGEEWYYELRYLVSVAQTDLPGDEKIVIFYLEKMGETAYFWITASDGGRESDHSNSIGVGI